MRGKLVNPFLAEIAQLDTLATSKDPDGAGALTSGYDPDFREPVRVPPITNEGPGTPVREERTVRVLCQIETMTYEELNEFFSGNSPNTVLTLVMHYRDLERAGFIDPETGDAMLRVGDRLVAFYDRCGNLVQQLREPVYCIQAQPTSYGMGAARNLLLAFFQSRESGARV